MTLFFTLRCRGVSGAWYPLRLQAVGNDPVIRPGANLHWRIVLSGQRRQEMSIESHTALAELLMLLRDLDAPERIVKFEITLASEKLGSPRLEHRHSLSPSELLRDDPATAGLIERECERWWVDFGEELRAFWSVYRSAE